MGMSLKELEDFAKKLAAELPRHPGARAHVVGLRGELGVGKTTFVQFLARELGIEEQVLSPTFTIAQVYPISREPYRRLVHVDAYRLDPEDSDTIGWREYLADPENLIIVEWPERLPEFPRDAAVITLAVENENTRHVAYAKK